MRQSSKIGPTCREKLTEFYERHKNWEETAEALSLNPYTIYRVWRGDKGVGAMTAIKIQQGLNLSTTEEIFS
jgi:plasmid maintenance system antidote protein VapI